MYITRRIMSRRLIRPALYSSTNSWIRYHCRSFKTPPIRGILTQSRYEREAGQRFQGGGTASARPGGLLDQRDNLAGQRLELADGHPLVDRVPAGAADAEHDHRQAGRVEVVGVTAAAGRRAGRRQAGP